MDKSNKLLLLIDFVNEKIGLTNYYLWSYLVVTLLILTGIYFSIKTGWVQIRLLKNMFKLLAQKKKHGEKGLSSFQAFCISTASRVGTGNIVGIAMAIIVGGPGAVFWMWVFAVIGSASGFIESTLAQIYKSKDGDGFKGGPAYYILKGLKSKKMATLFSISCLVFTGLILHMILSNSITLSFKDAFNIKPIYGSIFLVLLTGVSLFKGSKNIGKISELLVPVMAVGYIGIAGYIMINRIDILPQTFSLIISSAMGGKAVAGAVFTKTLMIGIKRGLFSNEAGMGSSPNVAASAVVSHPVKQGLIQTLGVFLDTLIICSATAFIILLSGDLYKTPGINGIELVQQSISLYFGDGGKYFVSIAVLLFSFSTILACYYYGETNVKFLTKNKKWVHLYKYGVLLMVLIGGISHPTIVWNFGDLFMGIMSITNLIAILLLGRFAIIALNDYVKQLKTGVDPVFNARGIDGLEDLECWHGDQKEKVDKKLEMDKLA